MNLILNMCSDITLLKSLLHLLVASELAGFTGNYFLCVFLDTQSN